MCNKGYSKTYKLQTLPYCQLVHYTLLGIYGIITLTLEVMVHSKDFENINIKMDGHALKQVSQFKYLVEQLQKMGKIEKI
jgi:hypothetical protein